jgi:hypothetical protein
MAMTRISNEVDISALRILSFEVVASNMVVAFNVKLAAGADHEKAATEVFEEWNQFRDLLETLRKALDEKKSTHWCARGRRRPQNRVLTAPQSTSSRKRAPEWASCSARLFPTSCRVAVGWVASLLRRGTVVMDRVPRRVTSRPVASLQGQERPCLTVKPRLRLCRYTYSFLGEPRAALGPPDRPSASGR